MVGMNDLMDKIQFVDYAGTVSLIEWTVNLISAVYKNVTRLINASS